MSSKGDFILIERLPEGWSRASRKEHLDTIALKHYNCEVERQANGKPFLSTESAHISISHTGDYIAFIGSTSRSCGIDIEHISRKTAHLSKRYTTDEEIAICSPFFALNPTLLIWCAKEALYKYIDTEGVDFRDDLHITSADSSTITAVVAEETITLQWRVMDEELLVVHTANNKAL